MVDDTAEITNKGDARDSSRTAEAPMFAPIPNKRFLGTDKVSYIPCNNCKELENCCCYCCWLVSLGCNNSVLWPQELSVHPNVRAGPLPSGQHLALCHMLRTHRIISEHSLEQNAMDDITMYTSSDQCTQETPHLL